MKQSYATFGEGEQRNIMSTPPLSPSPPSPLDDLPPGGGPHNGRQGRLIDRGMSAIASCKRMCCPPQSFNYPSTGNTRPAYLFPLFVLINIATFTDRSIVAGASQEFSAFVSGAHDSPQLVKDNPDAGIGLLQGECLPCSFTAITMVNM